MRHSHMQVLQALLKLWSLQSSSTSSPAPPHPSPNASTSSSSSQQRTYAAQVQQIVSDLGPLWVKLGQTLAVRPDVVGSRLSAALSGLQESAPPYPTATAAAILQQELGADPSDLFAWWSNAPVASASLGQVYQAAVKSSGLLVAVKVGWCVPAGLARSVQRLCKL
jgi:predicted unusual protein kinase regulating ubiquinone biosynthesis (AarF/ABC1/UbiB family)